MSVIPAWKLSDRTAAERTFAPADEAERLRAGRFRDLQKAQDYLHARHLVRTLAAETFDLPAEEIGLQVFDDACPRLTGFDAAGISWSRSGGLALAACLPEGRVGADLEVVRPVEVRSILGMIAQQAEAETVLAADSDDCRLRRFYRLWCAKEALLKRRGTGLRGGAKTVSVPVDFIRGETSRVTLDDQGSAVDLLALDAAAGCVAVLAFSG